eukprot:g21822.t1
MSLIDFMIFRVLQNGAGFTEVKLLKTLRIMRVFRVFRFFRQLTQLALMITDSIRSLIWALVLLAIIIYAFAIFLTANVSSWLHLHLGSPGSEWPTLAAEHSDADIRILEFAYGSLPQTVYTLVQAVLGGRSWHEVCTPLFKVGWLPVMLLFIYVSFVILAVLNATWLHCTCHPSLGRPAGVKMLLIVGSAPKPPQALGFFLIGSVVT